MLMTFSIRVRVYFEDTDAGNVVYYANYFRFMERARTEWLRAQGFEQDELLSEHNIVFAVKTAKADYRIPARLNDELEITAEVSRLGGASITFEQNVRRGDELLCSGQVRVVCLDADTFTPRSVPEFILQKLRNREN